jgi:hypothetical protein
MQAFGGRVGRSGHAAERIGGLAHRKLRLHRFPENVVHVVLPGDRRSVRESFPIIGRPARSRNNSR